MMRHMGSHASIKDNGPDLSAVGCAGRTVGFRLAYQARCCLAKAFSRKRLDLNDEIGCRSYRSTARATRSLVPPLPIGSTGGREG
jgi:hypothetical protein